MPNKNKMTWLVLIPLSLLLLLAAMIKRVHPEGDFGHSYVLAPYPSLAFNYGGGEEDAWKNEHPGEAEPWWLAGRYLPLVEVEVAEGDGRALALRWPFGQHTVFYTFE